MLRLVKWAYDLGIRHERVRIAAHLQVVASSLSSEREAMDYMIRDNKELKAFKEKRQRKLELAIAVNSKVEYIIQEMFEDRRQYVPGDSLMFPEGEQK